MALDEAEGRRASSRGLIPKAKVKTIKMTIVIIAVFVICWSPYFVFDLLQVFGLVPDSSANIAAATFIQSLAPLNSAANPLIYCVFSANIGKHIRNSWLQRYCRCWAGEGAAGSSGATSTSTSTSTNLRTTSTLVSHSQSTALLPDKVPTVRFSAATIAAQRF